MKAQNILPIVLAYHLKKPIDTGARGGAPVPLGWQWRLIAILLSPGGVPKRKSIVRNLIKGDRGKGDFMTVLDGFRLDEKTAIVTGAGRGIGRALAIALAEAGAKVSLVGRDVAGAKQTLTKVRAAGSDGVVVEADINTQAGVDAAIEESVAGLGSLDILVNNAGACIHRPALEVTREEYDTVMGANMGSVFFLSQAAAKVMQKQGVGNIITIGSISAMIVNRPQWQPVYNASKAAVHQLTKSFAAEWAPLGIRVNAIAPGYVKTEMAQVDEPRFKSRWIDDAAQERYAMPEELGATLVYMAGDGSKYMTGSVVVVDGGYTLF